MKALTAAMLCAVLAACAGPSKEGAGTLRQMSAGARPAPTVGRARSSAPVTEYTPAGAGLPEYFAQPLEEEKLTFVVHAAKRESPPKGDWKPIRFEDAPPPPENRDRVYKAYREACSLVATLHMGNLPQSQVDETTRQWLQQAKDALLRTFDAADNVERERIRRSGYVLRVAAALMQVKADPCGQPVKNAEKLKRAVEALVRASRSGSYEAMANAAKVVLELLKEQ